MHSTNNSGRRSPSSEYVDHFEGYHPADQPYVAPQADLGQVERDILALRGYLPNDFPANTPTENSNEATPPVQQDLGSSGQRNVHNTAHAANQPTAPARSHHVQAHKNEEAHRNPLYAGENGGRATTPAQGTPLADNDWGWTGAPPPGFDLNTIFDEDVLQTALGIQGSLDWTFAPSNAPPLSSHPSGVSSAASTSSRGFNQAAQPASSPPMTEGQRREKAKELGKELAPLRRTPITQGDKRRPGPRPDNNRPRPSNFDLQPPQALSSASTGAVQSPVSFSQAQQPAQQHIYDDRQMPFNPMGSMTAPGRPVGAAPMITTNTPIQRPPTFSGARTQIHADGEDAYASSSSSRSETASRKRKANNEPRGEAGKRAKMLTAVFDNTERTVEETLDLFRRGLDVSVANDFATSGASAIKRIASVKHAEAFLRGDSVDTRYYKLRIDQGEDNFKQVDGEVLENIRKTMLACIQSAPRAVPAEHKFHDSYDHDHQNQFDDVMGKLVNEQNHLEAASKIRILIEAVKEVHEHGIAMSQLNAEKFDTEEKINSPWLPEDAETRSCKKKVNQSLTCIERLAKIAEAIRVNKWLANDIMCGSRGIDWTVLICNPAEALKLKATNWESNNQKKLGKRTAQQAMQPIAPRTTHPIAPQATQPVQQQVTQTNHQQLMQTNQQQVTQMNPQQLMQQRAQQAFQPSAYQIPQQPRQQATQQARQRAAQTGPPPGADVFVIDDDDEEYAF